MDKYEKLYSDQLEINRKLREEFAESVKRNQKLRADLEKLTTSVDAEVLKRMQLTKEKVDEMIKLIDSVIQTEQRSIRGWQKLSQ